MVTKVKFEFSVLWIFLNINFNKDFAD